MVQQNMFPQAVSGGKPTPSTTGQPRPSHLRLAVSRQAGAPQARTAQLEQPQRHAHDNPMNSRNIERDSDRQPKQTVRLFGRVGRYYAVRLCSSIAFFRSCSSRAIARLIRPTDHLGLRTFSTTT